MASIGFCESSRSRNAIAGPRDDSDRHSLAGEKPARLDLGHTQTGCACGILPRDFPCFLYAVRDSISVGSNKGWVISRNEWRAVCDLAIGFEDSEGVGGLDNELWKKPRAISSCIVGRLGLVLENLANSGSK